MGRLFDLPFGYVESYDDNEVAIVSTKRDPVKLRLSVVADQVESNIGAVSFNLRRSDGRDEEYAYVMGRLTAGRDAGALYLAVRGPGEQQAQEVAYLDSVQAIFRVPVFAPNLGGQSGGRQAPNRLVTQKFVYQLQDDPASGALGRIVVYATNGTADESKWRAIALLTPTLL